MDSRGPRYAVVTLVTSDSYLAGALVALSSLLDAEGAPASPTAREFATVCLATPQTVGHATLQALDKAFDQVIGVEPILTQSWEELRLLGQFRRLYPKPHPRERGVPITARSRFSGQLAEGNVCTRVSGGALTVLPHTLALRSTPDLRLALPRQPPISDKNLSPARPTTEPLKQAGKISPPA